MGMIIVGLLAALAHAETGEEVETPAATDPAATPAADSTTQAPGPERAHRGHLDLYGGTRFPVTAGVGLRHEAPGRIQLSAAVGRIPESYVATLQGALEGLGMYEEVGMAADAMLSRSPYVHLGLGWRPLPRRGLVLAAGYQTLWLEGAADEVEIDGYTFDADISLASRLQMVTGEVRLERVIGDRLLLSAAVGGMKTVQAASSLTLPDTLELSGAETAALASLDDLYVEHFRTPTLGLSIGYRFF